MAAKNVRISNIRKIIMGSYKASIFKRLQACFTGGGGGSPIVLHTDGLINQYWNAESDE